MSEIPPTGRNAPLAAPTTQAMRRGAATSGTSTQGVFGGCSEAARSHPISSRRRSGKPGHTGARGAETMTAGGQPWVPVEGLLGQALGLVHPAMVRRWLASGKGFMRKIHPAVVRLTFVRLRFFMLIQYPVFPALFFGWISSTLFQERQS